MLLLGTILIDLFGQQKFVLNDHTLSMPGLPFSLDIILVTGSFFIFGRLFREKLLAFRPHALTCIASGLIFIGVVLFTDAHINLNHRTYAEPLWATLGTISGTYIVITLAYLISQKPQLRQIPILAGKSSLFILIFHLPILGKTGKHFASLNLTESHYLLGLFVSVGIAILLPAILHWCVIKHWASIKESFMTTRRIAIRKPGTSIDSSHRTLVVDTCN
jgi:fucose 4-O-acetylase-like acetyltransferase